VFGFKWEIRSGEKMEKVDTTLQERVTFLNAIASANFISPSSDPRFPEAREQALRNVQSLIEASRRAERLTTDDFVRKIDQHGIRFGIGHSS